MRLIDANALKKIIVKESFKHNLNGYEALLISEIEEFIDNAPTVEPERPQGEWIYEGVYHDENNPIDSDMYQCSICKRSILTTLTRPADLFPFCHCGADMRGEEHDK